jgi:hypothetical protein
MQLTIYEIVEKMNRSASVASGFVKHVLSKGPI